MRDAWRLSAGTFLVIPVRPPGHVDPATAERAMVLAPVTALPATGAWLGLGLIAQNGWLSPLLAAGLALTVTALLSRAMHLDGLADLADGLISGTSRSRALEVMKRGDTGPAGAAALVLVLLVQAAALAEVLGTPEGTALAVTTLLASGSHRLSPAVAACRRRATRSRRRGGRNRRLGLPRGSGARRPARRRSGALAGRWAAVCRWARPRGRLSRVPGSSRGMRCDGWAG
jgi:adenosylcobinamide-GDP ribazoletransferase